MQQVFSSSGHSFQKGFKLWREFLNERLIPTEITCLSEGPFHAKLDIAEIGPLQLSRITQGALRCETTSAGARRHNKADMVAVLLRRYGASTSLQDGREAVQRAGDILVLDPRPCVVATRIKSQSLFVEMPRERLEGMLGSTRLYSGLTIGANLPSTKLATSFIHALTEVNHQLAPDGIARMASITLDLIVASIAERLAQDVPRPLYGTVVVQRAKAFIEANLGDHDLDPPYLAAAMGMSLRRLQELFHERGRHISDYIWQRRLQAAAKRLVDPGSAHLSIGAVAYSCGFVDQAHFCRRFKALHGMTPSEYRVSAR
ncbi:helix-turn-helix domain-containing protein [Methylobacterium sp. yr668]|uniref:helix-turn-helix domain-containing protein n=1 Tax=Methylobacterium sp. yr668 TaxID=1761801 RepID=UPI0008EA99D4|nr:helix-turn-helix domain-containing protein [Methylobacterium sp. yr668]SFT26676.1 AraC-type DNA-binding protein [Methylobacterium sp. yr668]